MPARWFVDETDPPPVLKALDEVRRHMAREDWCYRHVQAIMVAIDQYAAAATGNREYEYSMGIGSSRAFNPLLGCLLHRMLAIAGMTVAIR